MSIAEEISDTLSKVSSCMAASHGWIMNALGVYPYGIDLSKRNAKNRDLSDSEEEVAVEECE